MSIEMLRALVRVEPNLTVSDVQRMRAILARLALSKRGAA
jgi:hypothetical protein